MPPVSLAFFIPVANLPPVHQRYHGKFATGINDTGGKFATDVNDTGGKQWEELSNC
jgi:hypothetical protein